MRTPWMRREALAVTAALVVLACTALLLLVPPPVVAFGPAPGEAREGKLTFVVALQPRDCEGNLGFLRLLDRPRIASRTAALALLDGERKEIASARSRIERNAPAFTLRPLSRREAGALAVLGYRRTPYWVLFDTEGRVRLAGHAPRTPGEYLQTARLLEETVREAP